MRMGIDMETVRINTPFIRLDALLKFTSLASSGGEAKLYIQNGEIMVNNAVCKERGRKLYTGDTVIKGGSIYIVEGPSKESPPK